MNCEVCDLARGLLKTFETEHGKLSTSAWFRFHCMMRRLQLYVDELCLIGTIVTLYIILWDKEIFEVDLWDN